jgi:hypothetical protein
MSADAITLAAWPLFTPHSNERATAGRGTRDAGSEAVHIGVACTRVQFC